MTQMIQDNKLDIYIQMWSFFPSQATDIQVQGE